MFVFRANENNSNTPLCSKFSVFFKPFLSELRLKGVELRPKDYSVVVVVFMCF